jgi:hypothetical protein
LSFRLTEAGTALAPEAPVHREAFFRSSSMSARIE